MAQSLIHLPDPRPVAPEHSFPILPPHCFPLLPSLYCTRPYSHLSLSLPLSPHSALSSGCLPSLVLSLLLSPSTLRMAFLTGEPPPRPPQPAIFTQSKWGCSRCLGPRPCPLSLLIPLLLEGTEPWPAGWLGGEAGVCCELLLLTWPGMPASPPTPKRLGFWNKCMILVPTSPLSTVAWPCLTSCGTCRGCVGSRAS